MIKLFYREFGAKNKQHLLIIHGLFGMSDNWVSIGTKLSDKYHVIIPDLRDHGQSPHSTGFTIDNINKDLLVLLKNLNVKKCSILGHSMGGKIAMAFATLNSSMIEKLIVVDATPFGIKKKQALSFLPFLLLFNVSQYSSRDDIMKEFHEKNISMGWQKQLSKNIKIDRFGTFDWKVNLKTIYKSTIYKYELSENAVFNGECLFLKGERSNVVDVQRFYEIKEHFPKAELCVIKDADHWVQVDNVSDFMNAVFNFLQ